MARYRRKPECVEAEPWIPGDAGQADRLGIAVHAGLDGTAGGWIDVGAVTERIVLVHPGQWIVTRPDGSRSVLSPAAFAASYEPDDRK